MLSFVLCAYRARAFIFARIRFSSITNMPLFELQSCVGSCQTKKLTIQQYTKTIAATIYFYSNNKHTSFSQKSNEVTLGFLNIISARVLCGLFLLFPILLYPSLQFCSYRIFHSRIFSPPPTFYHCATQRCIAVDNLVKSTDRLLRGSRPQ